jgi:putative copper export protein
MAAARWLTYLGTLGVIGAIGARFVVMPGRFLIAEPKDAIVTARLARAATVSAFGLGVAVVLMLAAQTFAWFGADGLTLARAETIVNDSTWGHSWTRTAQTTWVVMATLLLAAFWRPARGIAGVAAAIACAFALPLLGHGGTHGTAIYWIHAAHLIGSGLWVGTLAVLLWATRPVWRDGAPAATLRGLLASFSPLALAGAAMTAGSGALLTYQHMRPLDTLWTTEFGRTLLAKVAGVVLVATLGWINFRRHRRSIESPADRRRLRRGARIELVLAVGVVLTLTAWLTGLAVPGPH